jgi:mono/diheme cytochrome c family protein
VRWALLLAGLLLAGCGGVPRQTPAQVPPNPVTAGETLYKADCQSCHGGNAQGGIAVGSATSADIRWVTLSHQSPPYTSALLRRAILQGLDQTGQPLDKAMPRWNGRLSADQVDQVIAYLKSLH